MAGINIGVGVTGLEQLQKAVTLLEKSGKAGDQVVGTFKQAQSSLTQFMGQVKVTNTSFSEMVRLFQTGGAEFRKYAADLKVAGAEQAKMSAGFIKLATSGASWKAALDGIYSSQLRGIVNSKAQLVAHDQLAASFTKLIALRAQTINLQNGQTAAMARLLAVEEASLAVAQGIVAQDTFRAQVTARLITSTTGLTTAQINNLRAQEANKAVALGLATAYESQAVAATASAGANTKSAVATVAAGRAAGGAAGAFTTYGSAVRGAAGAMGMLWFAYGQLLPLMAAFAAVRAAKEAMSLGAAFEYTTKSIQSLSKDVEGAIMPLEKIQDALMGMEGLRHTPTELAAGMREFAKAGVAPADALRDLATMSKFATIAEMDLGEAIKDVVGLTLAFQPTMEKATGKMFSFADAANVIAAAAMLTITEVDEMAKAFSYVAELGIVAKMRFEEVAGALGIMANAGIRGTKAATSLRTGMIKLQTAGDPVHKMFKDLGRTFDAFNSDGSVKNVIEIFRELNRATAGLADEQRIAIFTKLFTARSMRAGAILSEQVKELDKFIAKLREAAEGVGFIEEKYQDLAHTARAELDYLRIEIERALLKPVDTGGLSEAISSIRGIIKDVGPMFSGYGAVIGAIAHDFIDLIALAVKFTRQLWDMVEGGISVSEVVDLLKNRFLDLVSFISNLNIVNLLREKFYAIDIMFTKLGGEAKIAAATIEGVFDSLGSMMKIIFGGTVNWIIDKLFTIPQAFADVISAIGGMSKNVPLLSGWYSPAMESMGSGMSGLIGSLKDSFKIDLTEENAQLEKSGSLYSDRIAKIRETVDALVAEKAAHQEAIQSVKELSSSYGVLANQIQTFPTLGDPKSGGAPTSGIGYFFGAGLESFTEYQAKLIVLSDSQREFLDKQLPMRKAQKDYAEGLAQIKALQEKLKGTSDELSATDVSTMMHNLEASTIGAGKAFKGSAEKIEEFNAKVKEAFGDTSQAYLSDYEKLQEKISDAYLKMKGAAEKEFGIGTPETAARMATINDEMAKAYKNAEDLERVSLDDFSDQMKEAFGDASTGKLSSFDKMMEKIDDTVIKMEAKIKEKFDGDDNGLAQMRRELGLLKTEAQQTADELRKADLTKNLEEIEEAFGKKNQKYMSDYDKELARINQTYADQYDIIDKKYPLEQASNQTLADRAVMLDKLNAEYEFLIQNSDVLILKSQNLWAGFALGVRDAVREVKTLGGLGYEVALTLRDAFHDTFVATLKGDFDSIGDLWDSLLDKMLDMFIDWIASLLARWAMVEIGNLIVNSFGGLGGALGGALGAVGLGGLGGGKGGVGGGVGTAATLGSTAYQMYTGDSLAVVAGKYIAAKLGLTEAVTTTGSGGWISIGGESFFSPTATGGGVGSGGGGWVNIGGERFFSPTATGGGAPASSYGVLASQAGSIGSYAGAGTYGVMAAQGGALPTSATGYYFGAGQQAIQAATPATTQGATTGLSGLSSYLPVIGAVVAIASDVYSWQKRKMAPTEADEFNKAGFRPETFADLIGSEFKKTFIPLYGETNTKWDETSSSLIMLADAEKFRLEREAKGVDADKFVSPGARSIAWDANAPTWKLGATGGLATSALFGGGFNQSGIIPKTIEEFVTALDRINIALDPSTISAMWEWGQATQTSFEKIQLAFQDLGLEGAYMNTAMNLLANAADSATGSTEELEKYLLGLGYTQEQVAKSLEEYTGSAISRQVEASRAMQEASNPAIAALYANVDALNALEASSQVTSSEIQALNSTLYGLSVVSTLEGSFEGLGDVIEDLPESVREASSAISSLNSTLLSGLSSATGSGPEMDVSANANGGFLRGGSGVRDDIYLGRIDGQVQLAKGGEYIVNPESTRRHLRELELINADKFALGGAAKGAAPAPSRPLPLYPQPNPISDVRTAAGENLEKLIEMMGEVSWEIAKFGRTELGNQIAEISREMGEMYDEAKALGASEKDLLQIRDLEARQIMELRDEHLKAQTEYMRDITDQISASGMSDTQIAIRDTVRAMEESIAAARELGLSETEIAKIRRLQQLQANEILEQQRKAQADYMQDINDQIKMFGMSDQQKGLFENQRALEAALESAKELGLGESELAKVRKLYGLKAIEIMNAGLENSLNAIKSFKDSLAGVKDEATKNAFAQNRLFETLVQARAGDFSGVEKIGEVLKDISIDKSKYATAVDYARDYWETMGAVNEIERLTEARLGTASPVAGMQAAADQALTHASTSSAAATTAAAAAEDTAKVVAEIRSLRESVVAGNVQLSKNTGKVAKMLDRWEAIGLPLNSDYEYTEAAGVGTGTITRAA